MSGNRGGPSFHWVCTLQSEGEKQKKESSFAPAAATWNKKKFSELTKKKGGHKTRGASSKSVKGESRRIRPCRPIAKTGSFAG